MDLSGLKRWQWALIGLMVGGLFSVQQLFLAVSTEQETTMNVLDLERLVVDGLPVARSKDTDIKVETIWIVPKLDDRNPEQIRVVGTRKRQQKLTDEQKKAADEKRKAAGVSDAAPPPMVWETVPFQWTFYLNAMYTDARTGRPDAGLSLVGPQEKVRKMAARPYLEALAKAAKKPEILAKVKYQWWRDRTFIMAAYPLAGMIVIGGIWPFVVNIIAYGRLLAPYRERAVEPEPADRAYRPSTPKPVKVRTGMTEEDELKLAALEAQMEKNLEGMAVTAAPVAVEQEHTAERAAEIRKLAAGAVETPKPVVNPDEKKDYKGEYYPVVRPGGKN